uniref:Uncharacterized protein n=1 Tax=Zooxanthella nutricula TaxID=1333877 RepID=A0A7S2M2Q3_9DINO
MAQQMVRAGGGVTVPGASGTLAEVASQLCNEMIQQLSDEHKKEVGKMYNEVVALRTEIENVKGMLEGYVGREKALREMMDVMMSSYQDSASFMADAHGQMQAALQGAVGEHQQTRSQLGDPVRDAERELARIQEILKNPAVPPQMTEHLHQGGIRR